MQPLSVSEYARIADHLAHADLQPTPAEAHGVLCGLICGGAPQAPARWIAELLGPAASADLLAQEARRDLLALAERTREDIDGPGLGFTPLLPGDALPLAERALGLYDWTRGFLYGLAVAGVKESDLSGQTREVFADFIAITQLDLDRLGEGGDNEEALTELTEFVWVAAMLVYDECGRAEEQSR